MTAKTEALPTRHLWCEQDNHEVYAGHEIKHPDHTVTEILTLAELDKKYIQKNWSLFAGFLCPECGADARVWNAADTASVVCGKCRVEMTRA